jgi:hypothetical protein
MSEQTLATASLIVAGLAAVAGLANALAGGITAWRDNRQLNMSMSLGRLPEHVPPQQGEIIVFMLNVVNPSKSPNLVHSVRCFIDGREYRCTVGPFVGGLSEPIAPFDAVTAEVIMSAHPVLAENFEKMRFEVRPVRGRRKRFVFRPTDLLLRF